MSTPVRRYGLFDFTDYIEQRVEHFTGREWVFQDLDRWLKEPHSSHYYLLTGEPGSGKSAIAARLSQFSSGEIAQPSTCQNLTPGFLHAVHLCSTAASDWVDPVYFARSVALQLARIGEFGRALLNVGNTVRNVSVQQEVGTVEAGGTVIGVQNLVIQGLNGQEAFNCVVLDPLRTIYQDGFKQPIVILVDALDEALAALTHAKIVDLLAGAHGLDDRVRFILTSRPEVRVENRFPTADTLSLSDPVHGDDNNRDVRDLVELRLAQDAALKSKAAVLPADKAATLLDNISSKADGNFQYVTFLLTAVAANQQSLADLAGLPAGLDGLYFESLRRVVALGNKDWATVYQPFLGVLSVAREPLTLVLLQTFTASATGLWNVYTDLIQFVEAAPESALAGERPGSAGDRYRLYHSSLIDFLHRQQLAINRNGQRKILANTYFVEPTQWHAQIVSSSVRSASDWSQVDWRSVPHYAFRHLVAHLYQLRKNNGYEPKLHALLEDRSFIDHHLAILGKPYLLLGDLRLGLRLALEQDDLAQAWNHIREYRRVVREQLDFGRLESAVETADQTGDYRHVTERTALYTYMPNSQALARLWIAWNAAASGHKNTAQAIVKRALENLPPRGTVRASSQVEFVKDAIGETLQRLLVRIAQAAEESRALQDDWLRLAISPWPAPVVEATVGRLSESPASWGEFLGAGQVSESMEILFQQLRAMGGSLDSAEGVSLIQRQLAAGLFNTRQDPRWPAHVRQAVSLIALDDYPSYREMALYWLAAAVLAHEDPVLARKGLATVLGGAFRPAPGFWGDTVAAAMDGMNSENNQAPDVHGLRQLLEHIEATGERGIDPSVYRKLDEIMAWRRSVGLPEDPWSFGMRRRSAAAAVLKRRGDVSGAETALREASAEPRWGSYAGFRALARLSLACRWLEWRRLPEALEEISLAEADASHVLDDVLRQERVDLVAKIRSWITDYGQDAAILTEEEGLAQLQWKSGLERGLFIEFLSALWFDDAPRLKRLLPYALDDATAADAVLGRLLGVLSLPIRPGRPFLQLVKVLHIDSGIESS
jgi:hypothetical protein